MLIPGPLSEQQWALLTTMWDLDRPATQRQIVRHMMDLGAYMDWRVLDVQLRRLVEKGIVEPVDRVETGKGRPWRYRVRQSRDELLAETISELFSILPLDRDDQALILEVFEERLREPELAEERLREPELAEAASS